LEFKSLIIVIVGFHNVVYCLVWVVYLGVQITDVGKSFVYWVILSCDDIIEQDFGGGPI
jgi:hypothetical protein